MSKKLKTGLLCLLSAFAMVASGCSGRSNSDDIDPNVAPRFDGMSISETSPLKNANASFLARELADFDATLYRFDDITIPVLANNDLEVSEEEIDEESSNEALASQDEAGENDESTASENEEEPSVPNEENPENTTDPEIVDPENPSNPEETDPVDPSAPEELIEVPEDNMPPVSDNGDIVENLLPQIGVNQEANITPYYAEINQDVYISVRIVNPKSYAILRFTLNGTVYQSYQFEDGSNSELLVLKVNSGSTPGIKEFTIDEIKYIADEDNNIRDVIIEGNQTVKLSVAYDKNPSVSIDNETQDYTSYTASVNVSDPYGLVNFDNGACKLYFYDGEKILDQKQLSKGINTFTFNELELGKTYQYMVVADFDRLGEEGFATHVLTQKEVNTAAFCRVSNVTPSHDGVTFDYRILNKMANVMGIYLFKDGEAIRELKSGEEKEFTGLLSNNKYQIRLYYQFELLGKEYVYYDAFNFTTLSYKVPGISGTFRVYESSVEYKVHVDDEDNIINLKSIKLYTQSGDFVASASYDENVIEGLNRNTNYFLHFIYSYDLNDGNGEIEAEKVVAFSTTKAVPEVEIRPYKATSNSIAFDLVITDPNVVGRINSIRLYGENNVFINQLDDTVNREFTGLTPNTKYIVKVDYVYDMDDGNGSQMITYEKEISTAKKTPTVSCDYTIGEESITFAPNINDPHQAGQIKSVTLTDGENVIDVDVETLKAEGLLSNHNYHAKLVYEYDCLDLTGAKEIVIEKDVTTVAKTAPTIVVNGRDIDYSSFKLALRENDPSNILKINNIKVSLGTLEVASVDTLDNLLFEGLYSNSRYTITISYEYDLNDGEGLHEATTNGYISTLKRDAVAVDYTGMRSGEDFIDFDLKLTDKDNLITIKSIELFDENEQLVKSLEDLSERTFSNLEEESFYTIVTTYQFDMGDGNGVQTDSSTILYGTSGSKIYINSIDVLNNENPKVGDEVQVLVTLDNPHALEITGIYISGVYSKVLDNGSDSNTVIVKFVPDTEGGYYTVKVTGYQYVTSGVVLDDDLTSEYEEEILVMGTLEIVDYFAISDTYYENYTTTPMRVLEIYNPTGYEIYEIKYLNNYWGGDNNTSVTTNFKKIDDNHILIFERGISEQNDIYDLVLAGITYGLEDVRRTENIDYLHCFQGYYNNVVHIKDADDLVSIGGGNVDNYNNQSPNYYILDNDIDCTDVKWEGLIAAGVFDGNGHTIKNIRTVINDENQSTQYYGLFKSFKGIIFDLTVDSAYFSVKTGGAVYAATISTANARVYDCVVKNSTIDITANNGTVVGVAINGSTTNFSNSPKLSTNNIVENLIIKTNIANVALLTDRNSYSTRINGQAQYTETVTLDAGELGCALGNTYIEKDGEKYYQLFVNDKNASGSLYIGRALENTTYRIHTNCDEIEDFDKEGIAITSINVTREGYKVEWYDNEEFNGEPISFPYISTDKTDLYASWKHIALAPDSYTYQRTSIWDETLEQNVEGYYISSFNIDDYDQPITFYLGGYHEGLPVFYVSYEAAKVLRTSPEGYQDDWDTYYKRARNYTVYCLEGFRFNYGETIHSSTQYLDGEYQNWQNYGLYSYWDEETQTDHRATLVVPETCKDFYEYKTKNYGINLVTYGANDNPYNDLNNLAPTDDENMSIKVMASNANNFEESIKYDKSEFPFTIEEGDTEGLRYIDYSDTRFAVLDNNVYVNVKEIITDETFRYIVYQNDEVVIDKLLNPNLQNIDLTALPYVVNEIASNVFRNSKVRNIVLNEGLISIGDYAFAYSDITSVTYPSTLTNVGSYAFYQCQNLQTVIMNDKITRVKYGTFQHCYSLNTVKFSSKLKYIDGYAFYETNNLRDIVLPYGVLSIGDNAFYSWSEKVVFIPSSVKTLTRSFAYDNYNCTIYTSVSRKPNGWVFTWNENDENIRMNIFYGVKEVKDNGTLRYLVNNDGNITIVKLLDNTLTGLDLKIEGEEGNIIQIGSRAFYEADRLKYIILPDTVNNVAEDSFNGNTQILSRANMKGSEWNEAVASRTMFSIVELVIGEDFIYALDANNNACIVGLSKEYTNNIVNFNLGDDINVTSIGAGLFSNNKYINTVVIPEGVTTIGSYSFNNCNYLNSVTLPESLVEIDDYAFYNIAINTITIPSNVERIGRRAFGNNFNLQTLKLNEGLETIDDGAFEWSYVNPVVIPDSVTYVGSQAFYLNSNSNIIHNHDSQIPSGWSNNFYNSDRVRVVYNNGKNYTFLVINANYDSNVNTVIEGKINNSPDISLYNESYIEGWYLDPEYNIEASFPYEGEEHINYLYAKIKKTIYGYYYLPDRGYTTNFISGYAPLAVSEPDYTKNGYYVEWYLDSGLTQPVSFPLYINESTTFYPKLTEIEYINQGDFTYYVGKYGEIVLTSYEGEDEVVDLSSLEGLTTIGTNAFKNNKTITKVIIPEGVTNILSNAFYGCNKLVTVELPSTLSSISTYAFYNCNKLKNIDLPDSLYFIGTSAFQYCYALTEITIPQNIVRLESYTFYNCYNLAKVNLPEGLVSIGYQALASCNRLYSIDLPDTLTNIDSYALAWTGIKVLEVPTSVTSVGYCALRTNQNAIIVTHNSKSTPKGWDENYCGQNESDCNIKVIYEDGKNHTVLVINGNYDSSSKIEYTSDITSAPSINIYDGRFVGWYLDPEYQEEASFPLATNEHLKFVYAKLQNIIYASRSNTEDGYSEFTSGYAPLTINSLNISKDGYYLETYLDPEFTQPVEFPYTIEDNTTFYYKWIEIEYIEQGDFTYYIDRNGDKVLCGYSGTDIDIDLSCIEGLKTIGDNVFSGSSIRSIIIPEGVETIGYSAFRYCYSLTSVTLPSTLKSINDYAFQHCTSLNSIVLPEGLKTIGSSAFYNTSRAMIIIPESVEYIGNWALDSSIVVLNVTEEETSKWDSNYNRQNASIIYKDGSNHTVLVVNDSLSGSNNTLVYTGTIETAPSVNLNNSKLVGWYLDPECTRTASFPFTPEDKITYLYAKTTKYVSVYYQNGSSNSWLADGYTPLIISEPNYAKEGYYIEGWYLDSALTRKVEFPYSVQESITLYPKLEKIVEKEADDGSYYYYEIGDGIVISQYCGSESIVDLSSIENLIGIGDSAFQNNTTITKVIFPEEGFEFIGNNAFYGCSNLTTVELPDSVTKIGTSSFRNCGNLVNLKLSSGLLIIPNYAFHYCYNLNVIDIPENVVSIGREAFNSCNNLQTVTLHEGLISISSDAFNNCYSLSKINLPNTLTSIGYSAFQSCNSLKSIVLPDSLTTVGSYAFANTGIRILVIPDSVAKVDECAFSTNSYSVVIHNHDSKIPDNWSEYCFGYSTEQKPTVIYDSARRYVVLVSDNLNYTYNTYLNSVDENTLSGTGLTWYLDAEYQTPIEIVDGKYSAPSDAHITYLYGRYE